MTRQHPHLSGNGHQLAASKRRRGIAGISPATRQRGIVLFIALIALVVMSLAAVALIRSVDTSNLIAGNLAFKKSATTSGDAGTEAAITWLDTTFNNNTGINVTQDLTHPFNNDHGGGNNGYYSSVAIDDPTTGFNWDNADSNLVGTDAGGNTIRYVIQRMCRTPHTTLSTSECLFSSAALDNNGMAIPLPQEICIGAGCPQSGQAPQYRITARVNGPGNTVSFIQSFVY